MSDAIIVAFITGGLTLLGTIITIIATSRKQAYDFAVQQAVMNTEIKKLTEEVKKHNNFAERMPVVENDIKTIYHELNELRGSTK